MKPDSEADVADLMARWRTFAATHGTPRPTAVPADLAARYRTALARAEQRDLPPAVELTGDLGALLAAWQRDWTRELLGHAGWSVAKARLAEVRHFLAAGQFLDASLELLTLLAECCPPARRQLAVTEHVRTLGSTLPPTPEELHAGLTKLHDWLARL